VVTLSERLNSGEVLVGSFVGIAHPVVVEIAGCSGLDFVIVDMEHTCIGIETVENMVRAASWAGIEVVVRIPRIDEALIGKLLDIGAAGIQVPQASSREYVCRAIAATKYPPSGSRGYMPVCRASRFMQMGSEEYIRKSNSETLVVAQVEGKEGLSAIKEILQTKDLDVVFLGPYDLSMSLEYLGKCNTR
jgi:4-hydroxy-2-oxoheptanedioate aldolase